MTAVFAHKKLTLTELHALVSTLFPLLKREFFMHRSVDEANEYVSELVKYMTEVGMLEQHGDHLSPPHTTNKNFHSAWLLSRAMQETWQRYAIVLHVLENEKVIGRARLEKQSQIIAERLSALFGMHSPEFYDKNVLSSFVNALRENKHVSNQDNGNLSFSESSLALKQAIVPLVWPEIVQHLEQIESQT